MLDFNKKTTQKVNSLNRATNHFFRWTWFGQGGEGNQKSFVHSSLRAKPLLTCSATIRNNKQVQDQFAKMAQRQQYDTTQFDELKLLLTNEVSKITECECKGFRRLMTFDCYKLAEDLAGVLLLDTQSLDSGFSLPIVRTRQILQQLHTCRSSATKMTGGQASAPKLTIKMKILFDVRQPNWQT